MQKFYEDTTEATFIKSLCEQICLPIYDTIKDGDYIFEGCTYITRHKVVRCISSGYYNTSEEMQQMGGSLSSESASVENISNYVFGSYITNVSTKILLNSNYYNEKTHIALGKYLRCLRDLFGINLMGLYNNFTPIQVKNYYINTGTPYGELTSGTSNWKCYIVPIQYNKIYTLRLDSSECFVKYVYKSGNKLTDAKLMEYSAVYKSPTFFNEPFSFSANTENVSTYRKQNSLYAFIQMPKTCNSSIVMQEDSDIDNPQIAFINDGNIYGFSDKLIQYICGNIITEQNTIPNNISYIKELLGMSDPEDLWSDEIKLYISEELLNKPYFDKNNYVDSELERYLWLRGK